MLGMRSRAACSSWGRLDATRIRGRRTAPPRRRDGPLDGNDRLKQTGVIDYDCDMDSLQSQTPLDPLLRALAGGLAAVKAYHPSPLPAPLDEEIRQGLTALRRLEPAQRGAALARIDGYARGMLASFCARAAMIGARQRDPAWIHDALLALLYTTDPSEPEARRGFFMDLAVIRRAAALTGLDDRALSDALGLAPTPEVAQLIALFLKWTPSQRAPEAHDMRELRTKRGVVWVPGNRPPPGDW